MNGPRNLSVLCLISLATLSAGFLFEDNDEERCYTGLGCFNNHAPFSSSQRPEKFLPQDPSVINTKFALITRQNWNTTLEEVLSVSASQDDPSWSHVLTSADTKVIVHGFLHSTHEQWVTDMVRELLKNGDMNVITVDWSRGAGLPYGQAAANARVVGAQLAQLINHLEQTLNVSSDSIHVIGHSLGAHAAGYAGERISGLGRITGLDPSAPYFENTSPLVRLDPSDASFVDVIHTDASSALLLGMGAQHEMGHVDFYPNGGQNQPGCDQDFLSKIAHTAWTAATVGSYAAEGAVACSHQRAIQLFTESINSPCPFTAYPCASAAEFKTGNCLQCSGHGCSPLGYKADTGAGRGTLYLNTGSSSTFCAYHYRVTVTSSNAVDGIITVQLQGDAGRSETVHLMQKNEIVNAGSTVSHLITTRSNVGAVQEMSVRYDKTHTPLVHFLYADIMQLGAATAFSGETQTRTVFCAGGQKVPDQTTSVFNVAGHCT